jgi:spermidine/putrescine-binding protein
MKNVRKSIVTAVAAAVMGIALVSGCSGGKKATTELNIFVWTEYMPQTVFAAFEKETGIKANVSTYSSNEDMFAKVKGSNAGVYDIVVPTDYMVRMMKEQGYLDKIDKSVVENIANIDQAYLNKEFDPGNEYSVPYMSGAAVLCVNKALVKEPITSYKQVFEPKYKNSLVVLNDFRAVIGITAKSLGYSLSTTKDDELAKVGDQLKLLKNNVKVFDSDSPKTPMLNGETKIGFMWNAEAAICMQKGGFDVVFPSEGCYVFIDNLCVLKGAKNSANAQKFINFILKAEISKLVSEEYPYLNPNREAVKILGDKYKKNPASNIDPKIMAAGEFVKNLSGPELEKYDALWTKLTK